MSIALASQIELIRRDCAEARSELADICEKPRWMFDPVHTQARERVEDESTERYLQLLERTDE